MDFKPFLWGSGGQKVSPASVKRRAEMAAALAGKQAMPQNLGEGINRIGEALLANSYSAQAEAGEAEGAANRKAVMDALLGNPDPTMADIAGALGNEWIAADPNSSAVLQALLGAEMQQNDPLRQLQIEKGQLELDALRNPPPPAPDYGFTFAPDGTLIRTDTTSGTFDPMGSYPKPEEGPLVQVLNGDGAPGLGKLSTDYGYVLDPSTNLPKIDPETGLPTAAPVPGSPAAIAAEQAAATQTALESAQISSDIEGAEKTLMSTRNVLDILDNSEGQPTTGTLSRPFALMSGTPAGRIRSYVSTLQSGVALGAMQRLKEASATGATGFGALSAPELNLLISDIGALDPDNTEPDIFRQTVQRIEDRAKRVVADIRKNVSPERIAELGLQEFLDTFDPPPANQSTPADIDEILKGYGL